MQWGGVKILKIFAQQRTRHYNISELPHKVRVYILYIMFHRNKSIVGKRLVKYL